MALLTLDILSDMIDSMCAWFWSSPAGLKQPDTSIQHIDLLLLNMCTLLCDLHKLLFTGHLVQAVLHIDEATALFCGSLGSMGKTINLIAYKYLESDTELGHW